MTQGICTLRTVLNMADKVMFTYKCSECNKIFITPNEDTKVCPVCNDAKGLSAKGASVTRKTRKRKSGILSFSDISFLQKQFAKFHNRSISYGRVVEAINYRPNGCIVCGDCAPDGSHICSKCRDL